MLSNPIWTVRSTHWKTNFYYLNGNPQKNTTGSLIKNIFQIKNFSQNHDHKPGQSKIWFGNSHSDLHPDINTLIDRNRQWAKEIVEKDPQFFSNLGKGQFPKILFIGCSDSRVPAETMTGCSPGEIFVHRNIANLVVNGDMNCLSVLQYGVEVLQVRHIIVCGHYGCGGVKAAIIPQDLGLIENWLRNIRDVYRIHAEELSTYSDEPTKSGESPKHNRLVELNVAEQCMNVYKLGFVQRKRIETGFPKITGLVYDVYDGLLKVLPLDLKAYRKSLQDVYKLYSD